MEDLNCRAKATAHQLMAVASQIRETGEEVAMMFALDFGGNDVRLLPAVMIDSSSKEELVEIVRNTAEAHGAQMVLGVMECWVGMNPMRRPSSDPARQEAILVTASGAGIGMMLMRTINEDGTLGDVQEASHSGGLFTNLSGREMMN